VGSYLGKHAELYDLFYKDKPYAREAAFIQTQIERLSSSGSKRILELACGTGRHAFEFEKFGHSILATDYSDDLLDVSRNKADSLGSSVNFEFRDMRELDFKSDFDVVLCLFDSIGYVQTNEAISKVFQGVRDSLDGNGLFIFEFWHAAAMLRHYEPRRERTWNVEDGEIHRVSRTKLDVERQLAEVTYDIYERVPGSKEEHLRETQVNRYFLVQEMTALVEHNGLEPVDFLNAYNDQPIDEDTWHILGIARRK
jgi:SAM-dependent methyltransferase